MRSDLAKVVITKDGSRTLEHHTHGECYHSTAGARLEADSLYIKGSGLEAAFASPTNSDALVINVLDVGLGLGYNALATINAWFDSPAPPNLNLISLEIDPDLVKALASGSASWQDGWATNWINWAKSISNNSAVFNHPLSTRTLAWAIVVSDAKDQPLPVPPSSVHFIWQDPFSPDLNPTMWDGQWFAKLFAAAAPGAVLMSYSVARSVKDALTSGGWQWERIAATGVKRHWLKGSKKSSDDANRELR